MKLRQELSPITVQAIQAGIVVPFGQALISGALVGLASGAVASMASMGNPGAVGMGAGAVAALGAWYGGISRYNRRLDARAGLKDEPQPREARFAVRLDVTTDGGQRGEYVRLAVELDRLSIMARGVVAGVPFSQAAWTGSNKPFSRSEFEGIRAELLRHGFIRWRSAGYPAQGVEITRGGLALFRWLANEGTVNNGG